MFGKLTLDAVPYHEPIIMVTVAAIIVGGLAVVGLLTYLRSGHGCGMNGLPL
jgi:cytochrome o ubiquinol oxidase subunit 1